MICDYNDIKIKSSDDIIFVGSLDYYYKDLCCLTWEVLSA